MVQSSELYFTPGARNCSGGDEDADTILGLRMQERRTSMIASLGDEHWTQWDALGIERGYEPMNKRAYDADERKSIRRNERSGRLSLIHI